jgi:hypothetical protein
MRKGFLLRLAVVLVAALAAPAMAGTDITGFYRAKAWMSNYRTNVIPPTIAKDAPTNAFVEQRIRLKFSFGEEKVKVVFFTENDISSWGDAAGSVKTATTDTTGLGAERNTGGALGGDRINTEIKNSYVWFQLPNTPLDFTVGLQNQSDAYAGLIFGAADMAGVFVNGKMEPVSFTLGWAKLYEFNSAKSDDLTLYLAAAKFAPTKDVKLGFNFYFLQDDTGKAIPAIAYPIATGTGALFGTGTGAIPAGVNSKKIYTPGVDFAVNAGPATISGFAIYQFGKIDYSSSAIKDIDISGFAGDVRLDMNAGPGKLFVEGLYISGGDNNANKIKSITTFSDFDASPGGNSAFGRTDMSILIVNSDDINCAQAMIGARGTAPGGSTSPALTGRGVTHLAAGYSMKFGDKLTGKGGLGYLYANNLLKGSTTSSFGFENASKGKTLGYEINANVNYNIMKGLDFGLYAAYGFLGDYYEYKTETATLKNPDDPWSTTMRLNYAF